MSPVGGTTAGSDAPPPDPVAAVEGATEWAPDGPGGGLSAHLHQPVPAVLVVRPSGVFDECTAPALGEHITSRAGSTLHIVLDLGGLRPLNPSGVRALLDLSRLSTRRGVVLHLVAASAHPLLAKLRHGGLLLG